MGKTNINDLMTKWLDNHGTVDKDKIVSSQNEKARENNPSYIKELPVDGSLDLHGLTRDEAWNQMEIFTEDSIRKGFKKIMFIHGKGNHTGEGEPVLQGLVRLFIERNKALGASGHPDRTQGGTGATWVMIKKK